MKAVCTSFYSFTHYELSWETCENYCTWVAQERAKVLTRQAKPDCSDDVPGESFYTVESISAVTLAKITTN